MQRSFPEMPRQEPDLSIPEIGMGLPHILSLDSPDTEMKAQELEDDEINETLMKEKLTPLDQILKVSETETIDEQRLTEYLQSLKSWATKHKAIRERDITDIYYQIIEEIIKHIENFSIPISTALAQELSHLYFGIRAIAEIHNELQPVDWPELVETCYKYFRMLQKLELRKEADSIIQKAIEDLATNAENLDHPLIEALTRYEKLPQKFVPLLLDAFIKKLGLSYPALVFNILDHITQAESMLLSIEQCIQLKIAMKTAAKTDKFYLEDILEQIDEYIDRYRINLQNQGNLIYKINKLQEVIETIPEKKDGIGFHIVENLNKNLRFLPHDPYIFSITEKLTSGGYCFALADIWLTHMKEESEEEFYNFNKEVICATRPTPSFIQKVKDFVAKLNKLQASQHTIRTAKSFMATFTPITLLIFATELKDGEGIIFGSNVSCHAVALCRRGNMFHFYDSNFTSGCAKIIEEDELYDQILTSLYVNFNIPVPTTDEVPLEFFKKEYTKSISPHCHSEIKAAPARDLREKALRKDEKNQFIDPVSSWTFDAAPAIAEEEMTPQQPSLVYAASKPLTLFRNNPTLPGYGAKRKDKAHSHYRPW